MKYFKDKKTGEVYAYSAEDLQQVANLAEDTPQVFHDIAEKLKGMTELKGAALEAHLNPVPTTEQLAATARAERDRLIESVRWRIERYSDEIALGIEPTEPLEPLLQYAQDLRDVPQQAGFPEAVEWPHMPSVE